MTEGRAGSRRAVPRPQRASTSVTSGGHVAGQVPPPLRSGGAPSPSPSAANPAEALKKGLFCQNQGQHPRALEWFDLCLAGDPTSVPALAGKAESLRLLGRHEEAIPCFEQALDQDPSHAPTWLKKGVCLESLARHQESLSAFDRAVALDPRNPLGWNSRGLALGKLGRGEEAAAAFAQALASPRSPCPASTWPSSQERLGRPEEPRSPISSSSASRAPRCSAPRCNARASARRAARRQALGVSATGSACGRRSAA